MSDEFTPAPEPAVADATEASEPVAFDLAVDSDLRAVWDKLNPKREANGQFASATETQADQPAEATVEQEDDPSAIHPPLSWSAELKAKWETVPPELRPYITQRDKENHEAITRAGQQIKSFEPMLQTLEQFRDVYESYNLKPHEALAYLFSAERSLRTDPVNAIRELCTAYKVDPHDLIGEATQQSADPRVSALEAKLSQFESTLTAQQRREESSRQAALEREIAEFAKDKPHFDSLQEDITEQIVAVRHRFPELSPSEILAKAYERAVKINPTISSAIEAEANKAEAEKRAKESEQKTREAKRAASVNTKGSPGHGTNPKTMEDTLKETAARLYA